MTQNKTGKKKNTQKTKNNKTKRKLGPSFHFLASTKQDPLARNQENAIQKRGKNLRTKQKTGPLRQTFHKALSVGKITPRPWITLHFKQNKFVRVLAEKRFRKTFSKTFFRKSDENVFFPAIDKNVFEECLRKRFFVFSGFCFFSFVISSKCLICGPTKKKTFSKRFWWKTFSQAMIKNVFFGKTFSIENVFENVFRPTL